jgi:MFS family permease
MERFRRATHVQAESEGPGRGNASTAVATLPFASALLVLFLTYWCVDIVSPALPAIAESLALNATGAGLVFSVFFAGRLVTNLPAAWLAERSGPRWTALVGATGLLAGSILAAVSETEALLLPARAIQGAGVAFLATAGLLSVLRARPGGGAAMTAFNVASGLGSSGALLAGGYLTGALDWQSIFWLSAAISGALVVVTLVTRSESALARPAREDEADFASVSAAGHGNQTAAIAANLLVFANYAIWVVSLPLLAAEKFRLDPGQVGLLLLFVNIIHLVSAVPIGQMIRRTGAQRALIVGFAVGAIGLLLIPFAQSIPWLLGPVALYAIGQVAGNSAAGDLILRLGGGGGRAVGTVRLSSDVGMVAGPAAAGVLADSFGFTAPFAALGLVSLGMAVLALAAILGRFSRRAVRSHQGDIS